MSTQKYDDTPIDNEVLSDELLDPTPPDIDEFLSELGIQDKAYTCTVKRLPLEGGSTPEFLPGSTKGAYPQVEDIGKKYGPGTYFICFNWKTYESSTNKQKIRHKDIRIVLGKEWQDLHDAYMAEQWMKNKDRIERIRRTQEMKKAYQGEESRDKDPIETMRQTIETAKSLGVPIGQQAPLPATQNNTSNMALLVNMMQFMSQQSQKSTENLMTMMMESNKTTTQLMLGMMNASKPQGNNEIMKEVLNMVRTTVNLKEALNPEKQTVVDRVFGLMESAFPAIIALASKPKAQRMNDPLLQMATNSKEFQAIKTDPEMREEMIKKWDAAHGQENTDAILETVGWSRPGQPLPPEMEVPTERTYSDDPNPDEDFGEMNDSDELENPLTGQKANLSGEEG